MSTGVPKNHFDRSKPFYPLVMQYLVQLIGFKELAARGVTGVPDIDMQISGFVGKLTKTDDGEHTIAIQKQLKQFLGPLQLRSEQDADYVTVDLDVISKEIPGNANYLTEFVLKSASSVLILAHELTKNGSYRDNGPLWEFLRHCRNAAAHGGFFTLRHGEPRRPARWGKFQITTALDGTPLFKNASQAGLLSPGDSILLLWDLEQQYPSMQ